MSHTFSIHLNPEKYWKKTGKNQKKIMHVTHILNPPKPRKILKKKMHVTHILNPPKPKKILTKNREKSRRKKWMSHTFSIHPNPEKY